MWNVELIIMQERVDEVDNKSTFSHVYKVPLDTLYNTFISNDVLPFVFFNKTELVSMKRYTNMADEGNVISLKILDQYTFTFLVENCISNKNFKTFTHRCINSPAMFASYICIFSFFWDSLEHTTIFEFEVRILDSLYKHSILTYVSGHQNKMFKNIEDYIEQHVNPIDQVESISINKNISDVYNYLSISDNMKILFGGLEKVSKISITTTKEPKNTYVINDNSNNTTTKLCIQFISEEDDQKEIDIKILQSSKHTPKQNIKISLIEVNANTTYISFEHNIQEYIDNDVLSSYSRLKKKILWDLKHIIEEEKTPVM